MYEGVVQELIDELGMLPGIGPKSAQRIAFHLLGANEENVRRLANVMVEVKEKIGFCRICGSITEDAVCRICTDPRRTNATICVVEEPKDVFAIERLREFKGRYHVLGGAIDPIGGVGPSDLRIQELLQRLDGQVRTPSSGSTSGEGGDAAGLESADWGEEGGDAGAGTDGDEPTTELILALDPNIEGEATASYLARTLRGREGLTISRLASGLPVGGDLDYADEMTLGRAFMGRRTM